MKKLILSLIAITLVLSSASARDIKKFNANWKFARFGAMPDGSVKAEPKNMDEADYDDSDWRQLNLPHDWGIEGPFRYDLPNRTGKLPWAGIGWYRKSFMVDAAAADKRTFIEFDGSMSGTQVWVNGGYVGEWPYGYSSFQLELTHYLKPGEENTIAVRLDNKEESSRWYPGGGIYRNVKLITTEKTYIEHWGVFVTTPEVNAANATVNIKTEVNGKGNNLQLAYEVFDGDNKVASAKVKADSDCNITLANPTLWDLDNPHLYTLKTTLLEDGKVIDNNESTFGVRTIKYTKDGFFLNGKKTKMNGVCQHHDLGPLGAAINVRAMERQIEILKEFGTNAIRTAHNPPAPEFLDLCDRMGVMVQVEAFDVWQKKKADNDYAHLFGAWHERDLRNMVRRDRNHPCVVMWSTGNEMIELQKIQDAPLALHLRDIVLSEDDTRPTSFGLSRPEALFSGWAKMADVVGINYKPHAYAELREKYPDLPIYASETTSSISSRGEYFFPVSDVQREGVGGQFHVSDYGLYASPNGYPADKEFQAQDEHDFIIGEFVWTGFDYIGEPTPFNKDKTNLLNYADPKERARVKEEMKKLGNKIPPRSSYFGIVDLCGFPKDRYYLYQAKWRPELPMAHILPHWNWEGREGEVTPVFVYTSGDEAELFLNGKSLGRKKKAQYEYRMRWNDVTYQPGELKVVSYKNGKEWATDVVKTTGVAAKIALEADRATIDADGEDVSFITVKVCDKKGLMVPKTHNNIKFSISGPAEILAVGNGDPTSFEPYQASERKVFNGMALVIVRSKKGEMGKVKLTAESEGLKATSISLKTE
ncbi:beta-galactosidase GalB [Saccharicrinis aurantiacus]|uniref:beta-galactosidase GalB n=1 Tax=Saccharicrinis aurantiacus TaxID=1849719 RepID=UPI00094FCB2E|nr:beta-galactosidase GalB [Saccharicrinis aurantiacus]